MGRLTDAFTDNTSACDGYTPTGLGNYNDSYSYSRGGNLIEHDGSGDGSQRGDYVYGNGNLEHAVTSISDGSVFSYDDNGNMTVRDLAGQPAQELVWDEGRRLSEVKEGSTTVAEFVYMIDDSRVRRVTDDGTATYYLPDGSEYTESAGGNYFTYYHSINGRTVAFTRGDTSHTTWMGSDVVNSTAVTRDEDGVVRTARYTPFGESRASDGVVTDHTFTGQVHDESSGLAFYNARYYDPAIGRFVTPDSIVPNPFNGEDYNRYSYVRNNPIRYSDPSGNVLCEYCNDAQRERVEADAATAVAFSQGRQGPGSTTLGNAVAAGPPIDAIDTTPLFLNGIATTGQAAANNAAAIGEGHLRPGVKGYNAGQPVWRYPTETPRAAVRPGWMAPRASDAAPQVGFLRNVGRASAVVGVVVTGTESYHLSDSTGIERALETAGRTTIVTGNGALGGAAGGAAGGAVSGLACGPGSVVCVPAFTVTGAVVGAAVGSAVGAAIWENIRSSGSGGERASSLCNLSFSTC